MADRIKISFPNLGIDGFELSSVAIKDLFGIEGFDIRWYAVILCIGIIAAFVYFLRRGKCTEGLDEDNILNLTLLAVPIGIVGARFLYVITNLEKYQTFKEMINIREGGIAIYGGIIFGAATIFVYSRIKGHNCLKYYDAIAPAVMLGQIIGRWGNFMNGEAYGKSSFVNSDPFKMGIIKMVENGDGTYLVSDKVLVHPTFLYESVWNLIGFVIVNLLYKRKKFDGQIIMFYVAWYGFGRAWIEFLRTDSLLIFGDQKLMVYLGFISCAAAIVGYVLLRNRAKNKESETDAFLRAKADTDACGGDSEQTKEQKNDNT